VLTLVAAVSLSSCAAAVVEAEAEPSPTRTEFLLQGTVTTPLDWDTHHFVYDGAEPVVGDLCRAGFGYQDIEQGAQVEVTDESGTTIGTGRVQSGEVRSSSGILLCQFPILAHHLPLDAEFYGIHVGNVLRGETHYTLAQIQAGLDIRLD